jgi:hypothetical protein
MGVAGEPRFLNGERTSGMLRDVENVGQEQVVTRPLGLANTTLSTRSADNGRFRAAGGAGTVR